MKTLRSALIAFSLLCLTLGHARAQAIGEIISYQGKITNADGTPVANGTYPVTIKINENGVQKTSQTLSVATLGGVFSAFLSIRTLTFDASKSYTLAVTANGATSTQPIASVPVAKTAANVVGPGATPIGGVMMWWSDGTLPSGWAVCDGATVSNATSPLNGKALPDLRDKFVRGVANSNLRTTPVSGGSDVDNHTHSTGDHTLTVAQIPPHRHSQQVANSNGYGGADGATAGSGYDGLYHYTNSTNDAGGGQPHNHGSTGTPSNANTLNNVPAFVGLVYIIRIF